MITVLLLGSKRKFMNGMLSLQMERLEKFMKRKFSLQMERLEKFMKRKFLKYNTA